MTFFNLLGGSAWFNSQAQYCQGIAATTQTCPPNAPFVSNPAGMLQATFIDSTPVSWGSNPDQDVASAALRLKEAAYGANPASLSATFFIFTSYQHTEPG